MLTQSEWKTVTFSKWESSLFHKITGKSTTLQHLSSKCRRPVGGGHVPDNHIWLTAMALSLSGRQHSRFRQESLYCVKNRRGTQHKYARRVRVQRIVSSFLNQLYPIMQLWESYGSRVYHYCKRRAPAEMTIWFIQSYHIRNILSPTINCSHIISLLMWTWSGCFDYSIM